MAIYVIVGAVVLAGLILAYRSFGRAASASIDATALLRASLTAAASAAADVAELAAAAPLAAVRPGGPSPAKALRRRISGLSQQLEAVDVGALDERTADAHALLGMALEELGWAAGLCGSDAYAASDGMRGAVGALREHAGRCLDDAAPLIAPSPAPEEVERLL